jgi:hypothetical protein
VVLWRGYGAVKKVVGKGGGMRKGAVGGKDGGVGKYAVEWGGLLEEDGVIRNVVVG